MSVRGASPVSPFTPGASDDECSVPEKAFAPGLPGCDNLFSLDCPAFPGLEEFFATAGLDGARVACAGQGSGPFARNAMLTLARRASGHGYGRHAGADVRYRRGGER